MAKHVRRFLYLPPGAKPRYRFVVAISTIVLIAFGAMAAVAALYPENGPANAGPTGPATPFPADVPPPAVADSGVADSEDPAAGEPTGVLAADYAVPSTWVWDNGFQAQVSITSSSATPQPWRIRLVYPPGVTGVVSSWVDGAPQPTSQIVGREFTFAGVAPVGPGQTTVLRLQFSRAPAADVTVSQCSINENPCRLG